MQLMLWLFFIIPVLISFKNSTSQFSPQYTLVNATNPETLGNGYAKILDIPLPHGYERAPNDQNSFGAWLLQIPLKKNKTVYLYDGTEKQNQTAQFAVINISVGKKNLQQCADAIIRLRSEYLFDNKRFGEIIFIDNDRTQYRFKPPFTRENFTNYLDRVFGMCGSASLAKQMQFVNNFYGIKAGDIFIKGGFPGHAEIILAVARNTVGNKIYLLAQSYMPAQDIHVLRNPANENL
ncbi:MAG: DUF4846 domain-containing protein [Ferruginibacter sp.]